MGKIQGSFAPRRNVLVNTPCITPFEWLGESLALMHPGALTLQMKPFLIFDPTLSDF
jgi:hypothetical protein